MVNATYKAFFQGMTVFGTITKQTSEAVSHTDYIEDLFKLQVGMNMQEDALDSVRFLWNIFANKTINKSSKKENQEILADFLKRIEMNRRSIPKDCLQSIYPRLHLFTIIENNEDVRKKIKEREREIMKMSPQCMTRNKR